MGIIRVRTFGEVAGSVAHRHDTALPVGVEVAGGLGRARDVDDGDGFVDGGAGDDAAREDFGAGVVDVLADLVGAVVEEPGLGDAGAGLLHPPAQRVVGVGGGDAGLVGGQQAVLGVVGVGRGAVEGQVAVAIVGQALGVALAIGAAGRLAADRGVLVEVVRGVAGRAVGRGLPQPRAVAGGGRVGLGGGGGLW